jgi:hypothetical protein
MRSKLYISYRGGGRNPKIEEVIDKHLGAFGMIKGGQWGFNEGSFQCLFLYKKDSLLDQFKAQIRRELDSDYHRLIFMTSN